MCAAITRPMTSLKRPKANSRGDLKGSIATAPDEVDEIVRSVYGKIYAGNTKDPEKLAADYMLKYKEEVFREQEANIKDHPVIREMLNPEPGNRTKAAWPAKAARPML